MKSTSPTAAPVDAVALAEELVRLRILPPDCLQAIFAEFTDQSPHELAIFLCKKNRLSKFQTEQVHLGKAKLLSLGLYRPFDLDGSGSLGLMYRAQKLGRNPLECFSLKALPLRSLWQVRQARSIVRLLGTMPAHPAVVPLIDVDSANGFHYLVWPLAEGTRLRERLAVTGPMPTAEVVILMAQLSAGLAHSHAHGVSHGLLSTSSILLPREVGKVAQIMEMGAGMLLAENLQSEESLFDTLTSTISLTEVLECAAPEWLADPYLASPAADQYALGMVGYLALTGERLHRTESPEDRWSGKPFVPVEVAAVFDKLLQSDPANRYTGMDEVREVFADLSGHQQVLDLLCPRSTERPVAHTQVPKESSATPAGQISWSETASAIRPAERDSSDASIQFDLPESSEPQLPTDRNSHSQSAPPLQRETFDRREEISPPSRGAGAGRVLNSSMPIIPSRETITETPRKSSVLTSVSANRDLEKPAARRSLPKPPPLEADRSFKQEEPLSKKSDIPLWSALRRNVAFWRTPGDNVQISVYGPRSAARSHAPRVIVYLHPPSSANSVATLVRAFQHDAELLGVGSLKQEIARGIDLAVHLAIAHIAVTIPLWRFVWKGQPHRVEYDLIVPWEAPEGESNGLVSVGKDDVRIGLAEFQLTITRR